MAGSQGAVGSLWGERRTEASGLYGAAQEFGGPVEVSVSLSGCASGAVAQNMGLLGWEPYFHGNPWAGESGLCAGNYGSYYLEKDKRSCLWIS